MRRPFAYRSIARRQPAVRSGLLSVVASKFSSLGIIVATTVAVLSAALTWFNAGIERNRAFSAAVALQDKRWSDESSALLAALADEAEHSVKDDSKAFAVLTDKRLEAICRRNISAREPDFTEYPTGLLVPTTKSPQHSNAVTDYKASKKSLLLALKVEAQERTGIDVSHPRLKNCIADEKYSDTADQTNITDRTGGAASTYPVAVTDNQRAITFADAQATFANLNDDLPPAPSGSPVTKPLVAEESVVKKPAAAGAAGFKAKLSGVDLVSALSATTASSSTLSVGSATGYDIDVFWCTGPDDSDRKRTAAQTATTLADLANDDKHVLTGKGVRGAGWPLGRIRFRSLTVARQIAGYYPSSGREVRGEDSEAAIAGDIVKVLNASTSGGGFAYRPSYSQTRWYLSVFVCS